MELSFDEFIVMSKNLFKMFFVSLFMKEIDEEETVVANAGDLPATATALPAATATALLAATAAPPAPVEHLAADPEG